MSECVVDSWDTCLLHGPSQLLNTGGLAVLQSLHTLMLSVHLSEMSCLVCYVFHWILGSVSKNALLTFR